VVSGHPRLGHFLCLEPVPLFFVLIQFPQFIFLARFIVQRFRQLLQDFIIPVINLPYYRFLKLPLPADLHTISLDNFLVI